MRDTPPSVQDGPLGWEPGTVDNFEAGAEREATLDDATAVRLARECNESSTNWLNASRRAAWSDSLRAFQSRHPMASKYLSRDYAYRSSLYRPKTRSMVRKDEAATASAFVSNEDVVSIQGSDPDDVQQVASAAIMKELLQYRLTKSIPWFLTVVGARQDAEVMGICIARLGWRYKERFDHTERRAVIGDDGFVELDKDGFPVLEDVDVYKKIEDKPEIDLLATENFRFDPGADWRNPVATSPYLIEHVPMYLQDVREKMERGPTGEDPEWYSVPDSALKAATDIGDDATRRSREGNRVPGKDEQIAKPGDFTICWVHRNIIRWHGEDWQFYTLGNGGTLLNKPVRLSEAELHGERPYVVGFVVPETHKSYPTSKVELVRDLQWAANDDWNLRFDNVKLALNPRQFVRAGAGLELNDLRTFAPGKTVMVPGKAGEPLANAIMWDRPPDVTASAYAEQDRINLDFDEMTGAFTNSSVQASQIQQQSATGMHLMSGEASGMGEYELRVFAETFVEPVIRMLIKQEKAYETDEVVLALAGKSAKLYQKYGIDQITDDLLNQELTTRVNVGIGATNPQMKMKQFVDVGAALGHLFGPIAAQGANFPEVAKELFGLAGYKDGDRFIK